MRLRQLATTQSITFYAPPEVHQSILNLRQKGPDDKPDSDDVVFWLLEQTCCNIEQLQPLYVAQGLDYCRRQIAAKKNVDACTDTAQRQRYLQVLQQPEHYSLEELYAPGRTVEAYPCNTDGHLHLSPIVSALRNMRKSIRSSGDDMQLLAHQEVEQEREVEVELETVREVKKPPQAVPWPQGDLHKDVSSFAQSGQLVTGSSSYIQVFAHLRETGLGRRFGVTESATKSKLYVTFDFTKTILTSGKKPMDEYARPVHWILWSETSAIALIISDHEANALLPILRNQREHRAHLLIYAAPATRSMLPFDKLTFYSVPALPDGWKAPTWLVRDLGIFAGRMYWDHTDKDQSAAVQQIMGLGIHSTGSKNTKGGFTRNPSHFMQEWLAVRSKGKDFSQTMMGELCMGNGLSR